MDLPPAIQAYECTHCKHLIKATDTIAVFSGVVTAKNFGKKPRDVNVIHHDKNEVFCTVDCLSRYILQQWEDNTKHIF